MIRPALIHSEESEHETISCAVPNFARDRLDCSAHWCGSCRCHHGLECKGRCYCRGKAGVACTAKPRNVDASHRHVRSGERDRTKIHAIQTDALRGPLHFKG